MVSQARLPATPSINKLEFNNLPLNIGPKKETQATVFISHGLWMGTKRGVPIMYASTRGINGHGLSAFGVSTDSVFLRQPY